MSLTGNQQTSFWRRLSKLDWAAFALCLLGLASASNLFDPRAARLLGFLGVVAVAYVLYRFWSRWRKELLWSLRNQLALGYLFLSVVPIVLLLALATMLSQILYSQLGAYLLYHDVEDRVVRLSDEAAVLAATESSLPANLDQKIKEDMLTEQAKRTIGSQFPDLRVDFD